jgi:outer membrane protein assembly factor BamB
MDCEEELLVANLLKMSGSPEVTCLSANLRSRFLRGAARHLSSLAVTLFVVCASSQAATVSNVWSYLLRDYCSSSPTVADDGTIYFGMWNGDLRSFHPDGVPNWTFHSGREIKSSPAVGRDGTVYFGSRDRRLYAVGPDGRAQWTFKTGGWVDTSPAISADGTVYFGSWDKNFYAVKRDGTPQWRFATGGEIVSSAAIAAEGTIYFGSHDGKVYALHPTGTRAWTHSTGGPILSSPAIDKDGTIYLTSTDGFFFALRPDGSQKWKLKTGGITESSPVIGQDGTIYVGANNALWAISPEGQKRWEAHFGPELIEVAPLALADDTVCFVSQLGQLINLSSATNLNWVYNQTGFGAISPAIGKDGKIYTMGQVVGTGIFLYALQTETRLAQSTWPKFRGDACGSGRLRQVP